MTHNMSVDLCGVRLKNPVMTASGTFGSGEEFSEFFDLNRLGAVVTKGVSSVPWPGNATPRICETPSGMLNAIGLQNPGFAVFAQRDLAFLEETLDPGPEGTKVIVNVCGHSEEEYVDCVEKLAGEKRADLLEINISCPNVKRGGITFGTDPKGVERITSVVRRVAKQPLIMKLSPNVTDITAIAKACEDAGADGVSLINTLQGMRIDLKTRKPVIKNVMGGVSGPAVFPVALRMVWQVCRAVKIPVIGMGGVSTAEDVLEMMMAGATAVEVGAANLTDPCACKKIIEDLPAAMDQYGIKSLQELKGEI